MDSIHPSQSSIKTYQVPMPFGHTLWLTIDQNGCRWVPLSRLADELGTSFQLLMAKMDKGAKFWGYRNVEPCTPALPVERLTQLLKRIRYRDVAPHCLPKLSYCQSEAQRFLTGWHGFSAPVQLIPSEPVVAGLLSAEVCVTPEITKPVLASELIPIRKAELADGEVNAVSGRDLHSFLEVGKVFAAWMPEQIEAFGFLEHQDFEVVSESGKNPQGGRPSKEYMLSISMAKELAMVQRTSKGKQARLYFIECERRAVAAIRDSAVQQFRVPTNLREALHLAAELEDQRMELACKVETQAVVIEAKTEELKAAEPAIKFHGKVAATPDLLSIGEFSKMIGTGQNRFFAWLRERGYIMKNQTTPYQTWVNQGIFIVKEIAFEDVHGVDRVSSKTYITGKGQIRLEAEWIESNQGGKSA